MRPWGPRAGAETGGRKFTRRFDRPEGHSNVSEWSLDPDALAEATSPDPVSVRLLAIKAAAALVAMRSGR